MSLVVRKPAIRICKNKDADQLRGNREAEQRLCFRYIDTLYVRTFKPLAVQPGLCGTCSKTPKTDFLTTKLK